MRRKRAAWRYGWVGVGLVLAMAGVVLAATPSLFGLSLRKSPMPRTSTAPVRRIDLNVTISTGGRIEASEKTMIDCKIENVEFRVRGNSMGVAGASTILSVVPDGTMVKKGDVLCVLDSSAYEEVVRQQRMNLERARADFQQVKLRHEVAEMNVVEFRDGVMVQTIKNLKGQIALAESDMERARDRLSWSRRMLDKGYLSLGQLKSEELNLDRMEHALRKSRTALEMYEKYTAPKQLQILQSNVTSASTLLMYEKRRLERFEERYAFYQKQVENCTIRAPHDGFLVYANEDNRQIRIEPGMTVRTRQRLFYLPDLSKMEVGAMLHESIVKDVANGQRAKVRVEALPGEVMEGYVEAVTQLPMKDWFSDVRYFLGIVKLENVPRGLRPGMTAEVEITTVQRPETLVIPAEGLTIEDGRDVCYVARAQGVERREVTLGQITSDLLEVTDGLEEGDQVILDPTQVVDSLPRVPTIATAGEREAAE
ncbi:MAG: efflux RND transporter periplasmic adaptor subunit [Isosphaeraceae bacterium]